MAIESRLVLPKIAPSEDVILFGVLGRRVLNPGYLDNRFYVVNGVEFHILHLIALIDKTGVLASGRASQVLITAGDVVVSTEDSSLEGHLVYVMGANRQFHLIKSALNDYYAVSWKKEDANFLPSPDVVRQLKPIKFKSKEIVGIVRNIVFGFDERDILIRYQCDNTSTAMLALDAECSEENHRLTKRAWSLGNDLSISHAKFKGINPALQDEINNLQELNESFIPYERDDMDNLFMDRLAASWRKELSSDTGVFASKAVSQGYIKSKVRYFVKRALSRYLVDDDRLAERVLWVLRYLPDYGSDRLDIWIRNIQSNPVPSDGELDIFADLVLQYGYESLAHQGIQEYDPTHSYRPGYCLSRIFDIKADINGTDLITPWFQVFHVDNPIFYPESDSTKDWLQQCEYYGSVVTINTTSIPYYIGLERFIDLANLVDALETHKSKLSLDDDMITHKEFNRHKGETDARAWTRIVRVVRKTSLLHVPETGIGRFIRDYLRDDGTYTESDVDGDEKLLRMIASL